MEKMSVNPHTVVDKFRPSSSLYQTPSFRRGAGSILNFGGNHYEFRAYGFSEKLDVHAIAKDWSMVGRDLKQSLLEVMREKRHLPKNEKR